MANEQASTDPQVKDGSVMGEKGGSRFCSSGEVRAAQSALSLVRDSKPKEGPLEVVVTLGQESEWP